MGSLSIAHVQDKNGYKSTWFDGVNVPSNKEATYQVSIPRRDGPMYFSVETYSNELIPSSCTTGKA
jgi:hypothetical protein